MADHLPSKRYISINLLSCWRDFAKRPVLKPQVAVAAKHEDFCGRQGLESLHISINLLSRWRDFAKRPVLEPQVAEEPEGN
jgi:hypothetical protein